MTVLRELAQALASGTTLAWCVRHAPDGDADAVIRREWERSFDDWDMRWVIASTRFEVRATHALAHHTATCLERHGSPCCAAVVRRAVPVPPTLAEMLAARSGR